MEPLAHDLDVADRILDTVWPGATAAPFIESENVTLRVAGGPEAAVIRLHRPGYQDDTAIASELAWIDALRRDIGVPLVEPLNTDVGRILIDQSTGRRAVLFAEVPGKPVRENDIDATHFTVLGEVAAALHNHGERWNRPATFRRFAWDLPATIGHRPRWGDWRNGLSVTERHRRAIEPAAIRAAERIEAFGRTTQTYGLIHADLRAANLIAHAGTSTHAGERFTVIDFDDSGFGWYLFDFAAATSFVETDARLPDWAGAWTTAYRRHRDLPVEHEDLLPDFVMMRRLQLLGWLGTHANVIEADPEFADDCIAIAERYLAGKLL